MTWYAVLFADSFVSFTAGLLVGIVFTLWTVYKRDEKGK